MKTQKRFILSLALFSIFSWVFLMVFLFMEQTSMARGPRDSDRVPQMNQTAEMAVPSALQKCGKFYEEHKLTPAEIDQLNSSQPGWSNDLKEVWYCKLRESFFNQSQNCPWWRRISASTLFYVCGSSEGENPADKCMNGFQPDTIGNNMAVSCKKINASVDPQDPFADPSACNPTESWVRVLFPLPPRYTPEVFSNGVGYQVCGKRIESNAPFNLAPSGDGSSAPLNR